MSTIPKSLTDIINVTLCLHRDAHENGMTVTEYADGILAGNTDCPVLDHKEFVYQFGATDENLQTVITWATNNNLTVTEAHHGQSLVKLVGTVETFNNLFNIILQDVTDSDRTYMIPKGTPKTPDEIKPLIEQVLGFDESLVLKKNITPPQPIDFSSLTANGSYVAHGQSLATAYDVPTGNGYGICIGILEFTYSGYVTGYNQTDLNTLSSFIGITLPTPINYTVDGATISSTSDTESILDIMCAGTACPSAKLVYYQGQNSVPSGIFNTVAAAVNDTVNNPCVLSISYGMFDITDYDTIFASAIVKGITIFVSSGDFGSENYVPKGCTSPYAVVVGGTSIQLSSSNTVLNEIGASSSGGGISIGAFGRPAQPLPTWQSGLTYTTISSSGYVAPSASLTARATPDLCAPMSAYSATAQYNDGGGVYPVTVNGSSFATGGTSASAPIIAGFWARITALIGKRIPFDATLMYANQSKFFRDITTGNNAYNNSAGGYITTPGWDPVTGLGVPKFRALYQYYHTGSTFPKQHYGFRPSTGHAYPRRTTGVR